MLLEDHVFISYNSFSKNLIIFERFEVKCVSGSTRQVVGSTNDEAPYSAVTSTHGILRHFVLTRLHCRSLVENAGSFSNPQ